MRKNAVMVKIVGVAIVIALMLVAMSVGADSGLPGGYAKIKDWDQAHEAFSFSLGKVVSEGGDFFIADRGEDSIIHVFDSPGIIDMGDIPLDDIKEAPASGYVEMATPIDGHSYVVRSKGKYGKFYLDETYDWKDPTEYGIEWVYQLNGTRTFGGAEAPGEPATQGQTGTGREYECPQDAGEAYQQYIAAYNKLTYLMAEGNGDTPEALAAYEEYKAAKACYESRTGGFATFATIEDWDESGDSFGFSLGKVVSEGGDFFIADRGENSIIHVFDSPGIIDMGDIPLGDIKEAPESGYEESAKPIEGHSYVMWSQGKYGKIRIEDIFSPEDYDWISVTEYEFEWVYQPDGTRSFGGGVAPTPTPTGYSDFGTTEILKKGFKGNIYYLEEGTSKLPDFSKMTPVGTIYTEKLDIPPRDFKQGFPGITDRFEWFGISYIGGIVIPSDGNYTFKLTSDDGAKLYIDGELVIDNDGIHPPRSKTKEVHLTKGDHLIGVDYFQGPKVTIALQLFVETSDGKETPVKPVLDPSELEEPTPTPSPTQQLKISDLRGTLNTDNECNLYVADYGDKQVKMINPNGSVTTYASGIDRPRYQVFDSAGNLYVGSFDGNIYKVSASGGKTVVASGIWSPQGMGFDSAGNLYVAGGYDGKIHRIAPDGSKTTRDSGFAHPKHLAVYSNGNIYVVDSGGTLIVRITPEGEKASLVDLGETILGMATDGEYLYVSHSDKISRIDTFGQVTHIATDLDQPSSLTVCNGNVFVTVRDGIVKLKISLVSGALKISDLRGFLNTDNDCNLYVADWGDNQVKMINPNGSTTSYASGIDRPRYQVFDSAGNLYVGSFDGNIYKVSASGGKTVVASGIWSPQGMGFDSVGNLYVAGGYDGKIHRIAPDGSKTTMDSGFAHPKHLAVYSDGNIYVVDSNGTLIVMITPEGGKTSLVDLGEPISGMATDGEYLYVSHSDKISRIDTSGQVTQIATDLDQPTHLTVCNGSVFVTVSDGIVKLKISDETKTGTCDWTGAWETDWGRMELQQNGNTVNGTYTHDQGRIQGTVSGRKLTGTWSEYPSYSPPGDAGDIVFIISEDCSSFDGTWRYGTSGGWSGSWTGARKSTGSGTSYLEATLTHSGFDFSEGTTGESPIRDGEVISWQPGAATHPDYPRDSEYLWWRNTYLDKVNYASQTKDMGAVDIATVRAVPAEWDKSPLIPPLLVGHTIVAKCYDGYVKFQVISVDPADESARVKYGYSPDTTFDEGTPTLQPTLEKTEFAKGIATPMGFAFDLDGRLFVGNRERGEVFGPITRGDNPPPVYASGLGAVADIAFDEAGYLYACNDYSGNIYKVPPGGGEVHPFFTGSTFAGTEPDPNSLNIAPPAFSGSKVKPGDLIVMDRDYGSYAKRHIVAISPTGEVTLLAGPEELPAVPSDGDFSPDGRFYVTTEAGSIFTLDADGVITEFGKFNLTSISSLSINLVNGDIFVGGADKIFKIDPHTKDIVVFAKDFGVVPWWSALSVSPDGKTLYVGDSNADTVYTISL